MMTIDLLPPSFIPRREVRVRLLLSLLIVVGGCDSLYWYYRLPQ